MAKGFSVSGEMFKAVDSLIPTQESPSVTAEELAIRAALHCGRPGGQPTGDEVSMAACMLRENGKLLQPRQGEE